jgi:hypothetical protein
VRAVDAARRVAAAAAAIDRPPGDRLLRQIESVAERVKTTVFVVVFVLLSRRLITSAGLVQLARRRRFAGEVH